MTEPDSEALAAQEMIRAVYEDQEAEINGRTYQFTKMVHKERRTVFAFYSSIQAQLGVHNFSFLDAPEFEKVERIMWNRILFNGSALSRIDNHWEKYPADYMPLISTAMAVISYPFLAVSPTV